MRAILLDVETATLREGDESLVADWQASPSAIIWLDMEEVDERQRTELLEGAFGLHPLAINDALRERHPPKFEHFTDHLFLRLRGLDADTQSIDFGVIGISIFVGARFLVTRRTARSIGTDALWHAVRDNNDLLRTPPQLALNLTGRVVRRYVPILISMEPRLESLEHEIFERPNDALLAELTGYKSNLTQLRRIFAYHEQMLEELRGHAKPFYDEEAVHDIVDVHDQVRRSLSLAELHYSLIDDLQNAYIAIASHRLNQVMRILTVITVIFVPLSFLAGIYGMNFDNMPELHSRFGYYVLLGVMASIAALLLALFRRRKWL